MMGSYSAKLQEELSFRDLQFKVLMDIQQTEVLGNHPRTHRLTDRHTDRCAHMHPKLMTQGCRRNNNGG